MENQNIFWFEIFLEEKLLSSKYLPIFIDKSSIKKLFN